MKNEYDLITQKGRMVNRVCFLTSAFAPSALRPCAFKMHFFSFQTLPNTSNTPQTTPSDTFRTSPNTSKGTSPDTSPNTSHTPPRHLPDTSQKPPRQPKNPPFFRFKWHLVIYAYRIKFNDLTSDWGLLWGIIVRMNRIFLQLHG